MIHRTASSWSFSSKRPSLLLTSCNSLVPWKPLPRPSNFSTMALCKLTITLSHVTSNLSVTIWLPGVPSLKHKQASGKGTVLQETKATSLNGSPKLFPGQWACCGNGMWCDVEVSGVFLTNTWIYFSTISGSNLSPFLYHSQRQGISGGGFAVRSLA